MLVTLNAGLGMSHLLLLQNLSRLNGDKPYSYPRSVRGYEAKEGLVLT